MTLRAIDLMRAGSLCVETAKYLETSLQELISKTRFLPGPPVVASMTSVTVGPAAARSAAVKVESAIEVVSSKRPPSRSVDLLGATATVGAVVEEKEDMADDWGRGYEAEFLRHRADGELSYYFLYWNVASLIFPQIPNPQFFVTNFRPRSRS